MDLSDATHALIHSSHVTCIEARDAVSRSVSMRKIVRATVLESRRLRAAAVILREDAWILPGIQEP